MSGGPLLVAKAASTRSTGGSTGPCNQSCWRLPPDCSGAAPKRMKLSAAASLCAPGALQRRRPETYVPKDTMRLLPGIGPHDDRPTDGHVERPEPLAGVSRRPSAGPDIDPGAGDVGKGYVASEAVARRVCWGRHRSR